MPLTGGRHGQHGGVQSYFEAETSVVFVYQRLGRRLFGPQFGKPRVPTSASARSLHLHQNQKGEKVQTEKTRLQGLSASNTRLCKLSG